MKRILSFALLALTLIASRADAKLNVACSYPWIADLASKIGGDRVSVSSLSRGSWNPHFVVPRPSLIVRAREADLLIINGAQLEIGWLPPVVRESRNPNIQQGTRGLLDLSTAVRLIDKPVDVSRSGGDVHPDGNPHYALDPHNIIPLSSAVAARYALIDPEGAALYESNLSVFRTEWKKRLAAWDSRLSGLRGIKAVSYHSLYNYFARRYGIMLVGTVEPLPGIPPSSRHMESLVERSRAEKLTLVLQDVYNPAGPSRMLAGKTGARLVVLPHDVGSVPEANDLFGLFDSIAGRLER